MMGNEAMTPGVSMAYEGYPLNMSGGNWNILILKHDLLTDMLMQRFSLILFRLGRGTHCFFTYHRMVGKSPPSPPTRN